MQYKNLEKSAERRYESLQDSYFDRHGFYYSTEVFNYLKIDISDDPKLLVRRCEQEGNTTLVVACCCTRYGREGKETVLLNNFAFPCSIKVYMFRV